jgi:hypothetical protein
MELGSYFLFLQEQIKDIIIISRPSTRSFTRSPFSPLPSFTQSHLRSLVPEMMGRLSTQALALARRLS